MRIKKAFAIKIVKDWKSYLFSTELEEDCDEDLISEVSQKLFKTCKNLTLENAEETLKEKEVLSMQIPIKHAETVRPGLYRARLVAMDFADGRFFDRVGNPLGVVRMTFEIIAGPERGKTIVGLCSQYWGPGTKFYRWGQALGFKVDETTIALESDLYIGREACIRVENKVTKDGKTVARIMDVLPLTYLDTISPPVISSGHIDENIETLNVPPNVVVNAPVQAQVHSATYPQIQPKAVKKIPKAPVQAVSGQIPIAQKAVQTPVSPQQVQVPVQPQAPVQIPAQQVPIQQQVPVQQVPVQPQTQIPVQPMKDQVPEFDEEIPMKEVPEPELDEEIPGTEEEEINLDELEF